MSVTFRKDTYTEVEAARALGISLARLRLLLDQHVFNDGTTRPENVVLQASDLVLLGFWQQTTPNSPSKLLRMPRRR